MRQETLFGGQRLDGKGGEDDILDSETGIDRVELAGQQLGKVPGIAARPGGAEADMFDPAVDAVKAKAEPARAHARHP